MQCFKPQYIYEVVRFGILAIWCFGVLAILLTGNFGKLSDLDSLKKFNVKKISFAKQISDATKIVKLPNNNPTTIFKAIAGNSLEGLCLPLFSAECWKVLLMSFLVNHHFAFQSNGNSFYDDCTSRQK